MVLFKVRAFLIAGPVLFAAAMYPLRGWYTLFFWFYHQPLMRSVRLPIRALAGGSK